MAVAFLTAIDEFLLDRVFQPIADRLHQWWGVTTDTITEFLCIGNILFILASHVLKDPILYDFGTSMQIFTTGMDVIASIILSIVIVFPRFNDAGLGLNIKRVNLFFFRTFWLLCTLVNLVTLPGLILIAVNTFHVGGICTQFAAQLCLWTACNFASLHKPPPRKQRESKFLAWLRPRYAT